MDQNEIIINDNKAGLGSIRIADEVVRIVAGLAATDIAGVAGMSGGVVGGITEMLGRKNMTKGVKVEVGEKETAVDLYIVVEYGVRIPEVAVRIQEAVKKAIEEMTGLHVIEVNINIQGIALRSEAKEEDHRVK